MININEFKKAQSDLSKALLLNTVEVMGNINRAKKEIEKSGQKLMLNVKLTLHNPT